MAEEVLIKIEVEKGTGEQQVDNMTRKILDLTNANKNLIAQNKELEKTGQQNSQQYIENTRQIEINKQKITEATASRKGLVQSLIAEDDSIKGLKLRNAELIKQRDQLSTSTEAGRKSIQNINNEIDKNNQTIKSNVSVLEKQKINIGNYASALDGVVPGLGGFVSGIQGATKAGLAFIATPLGAILAAIGVVVAAVVVYFQKFEFVLDIIEDAVTKTTAVFDSFIQNLDKVAAIVGNVLVGNFSKAADQTRELAEEFGNAANEAQRLLDATRDLEDAEFQYRIESAAAANQMKAWVIAAKNRNLSVEESNALLQKASDLENELTDKAVKNAQARADIEEGKLIASKKAQLEAANLLRQAGEEQSAYISRLIESGLFSPEQLEPLVSAYEKVQQEASAGLAFQEKIANQQAALFDKQEAENKKRAENAAKEREKKADEAAKAREKELEEDRKLREDLVKAEEEQFKNNSDALDAQNQERLTKLKEKYLNDLLVKEDFEAQVTALELSALETRKAFLIANGEDTVAIEAAIVDAKIKLKERESKAELKILSEKEKARVAEQRGLAASLDAGVALAKEAFGENKAIAVAETVINTVRGIVRAIAEYPFPYSAIVSTLVGAIGTAQTARIVGIQFAKGGVLNGPSHAQGGIPFSVGGRLGFEAEGGEAIINKKSTRLFRPLLSAINEAGGGTKFQKGGITFATGGVTTQQASQQAQNQLNLQNTVRDIMSSMPPIVVTVEDINARTEEVAFQTQKAQVI